jgi:hypothetical protein
MTVGEFVRDKDFMFALLLSGLAMVVAFAAIFFLMMHVLRG